jgi:hypothetical protein
VNVVPEQMAEGVSVELNTGVGLITIVTFCVLLQPPAERVNAYVTVIGLSVLLVRVSLMVAEEPLPVLGVMPGTAARVQLKFVPAVSLVAV